jgi:Uma2 family endonuclease
MSTTMGPRPVPAADLIPPLEPGDRLARAEFERRYQAMPDLKKAELLDGVVHMPSPVRFDHHARPHALLAGWLLQYAAMTPGVEAGDNATCVLAADSETQPDLLLMIPAERGGQARVAESGYVEGCPELVCEVASSSVSIDLGQKLDLYRRAGAKEYLVWRVLDEALDWFRFVDGRQEQLTADAEGVVRSEVFPGLWLDVPAMLSGKLARVLEVVRQGVGGAEHAAFVARLGAKS